MRSLAGNRPLLLVLGVFAVSRVAYLAAGVEFDASPLDGYWQYIDPALLQDRLGESLWHAHAQPPLFNLLVGMALKLPGESHEAVLNVLFLLLGLALALLLHALLRRLGVGRWASAIVAAVYAASPAAVLYENWLYVEQLVAVCLLGAAVLLHRFAERSQLRDGAGAFGLLAVVVLTRPLFHLVWIVGIALIVWVFQPGRRRAVAAAAAVPLVLVVALYAKNYALFETVSSTSCSGINAARVTTFQLTEAEIGRLVRAGKISTFAAESPFALPTSRPEVFRREPKRGVPLLDRARKSTGAPNFDHAAYLDICDRYLEDARTVLREHPGAFKRGFQQGSFIYWRPPSQYPFLTQENRDAVTWPERAYGLLLYGQLRPATDLTGLALAPRGDYRVTRRIGEVAWFALIGYLAAIAFAVVLVARAVRRRRAAPLDLVAAYVLFNVVWVTVVGTAFEAGENNRFRYLVDPLALALLASLVARVLARRRGRTANGHQVEGAL